MGQGLATIGKHRLQIRKLHQATVIRQGRQRMAMPIDPTGQVVLHGKAGPQSILQDLGRSEGKLPPLLGSLPGPPGTDTANLCVSHRIEGVHHLHQS